MNLPVNIDGDDPAAAESFYIAVFDPRSGRIVAPAASSGRGCCLLQLRGRGDDGVST